MRRILLSALLVAMCAVYVHAQQTSAPLAFTTDKALPKAILTTKYEAKLEATGGLPPRTWEVIDGKLPAGLMLDTVTGTIMGSPTALGQYRFAVEVSDSQDPPESRTREFSITVVSALVVEWKTVPAVTTDGIAGSIRLANQTANDLDLTAIIVAVNEVGKAFVLGYQHFTFAAQSAQQDIPFGSSLPRGTYIVHADTIAEVASSNSIYHARLQTSQPLATH
jgi:hypothetical protein